MAISSALNAYAAATHGFKHTSDGNQDLRRRQTSRHHSYQIGAGAGMKMGDRREHKHASKSKAQGLTPGVCLIPDASEPDCANQDPDYKHYNERCHGLNSTGSFSLMQSAVSVLTNRFVMIRRVPSRLMLQDAMPT